MNDETQVNSHISSDLKLYVKTEADKARNQALGLFAFLGVVIGVLSYFGINNAVEAQFDRLVKQGVLRKIEEEAEKITTKLSALEKIDVTFQDDSILLISSSPNCPPGWEFWRAGQGKFLRSIDPSGKIDSVRQVNDTQLSGTALPRVAFNVSKLGEHTHNITGVIANGSGNVGDATATRRGNGDKTTGAYNDSKGVSLSGLHSHAITGGDKETRPINIAVNICAKKI